MIKIAHEAPKAIFGKMQELTDYDYASVASGVLKVKLNI
jgi:hypothetical protein